MFSICVIPGPGLILYDTRRHWYGTSFLLLSNLADNISGSRTHTSSSARSGISVNISITTATRTLTSTRLLITTTVL